MGLIVWPLEIQEPKLVLNRSTPPSSPSVLEHSLPLKKKATAGSGGGKGEVKNPHNMAMPMEMEGPKIERTRSCDCFDEEMLPTRKKIKVLYRDPLHLPEVYRIDNKCKSGTEEDEDMGGGTEMEAPRIYSTSNLTPEELEDLSENCEALANVLRHLNLWKIASMDSKKIKELRCELRELELEINPASTLEQKTEQDMMARRVNCEEDVMARHRRDWESQWGDKCGKFEDMTTLSPMLFTHLTPACIPPAATVATTLQVYSIKVTEIKGDLQWPLNVYGVVAARDSVDHNRNVLFLRRRDNCQILTRKDCYLRLTGPSRAIVLSGLVHFEIQLTVKGTTKSQDRVLFSHVIPYETGSDGTLASLSNESCTLDFNVQQLLETVQATIMSVQVTECSPWPFEYGARIVTRTDSAEEIVLFDSQDGTMPLPCYWPDGYLHLIRSAVSVQLQGTLTVLVQAHTASGGKAEGYAVFTPKRCGISREKCSIGDSKLEIIVAWSLFVDDKRHILC